MGFLDDNYKHMIALTLLGVLYLVWREANLKVEKNEGFGASMRMEGTRFSGGNQNIPVTLSQRNPSAEYMGAYEPPVFWNAGSYAAVGTAQKGIDSNNNKHVVFKGGDGTDDGSAWVGITSRESGATDFDGSLEGMVDYGKLNSGSAYEGMSSSKSPYSDDSLNKILGM